MAALDWCESMDGTPLDKEIMADKQSVKPDHGSSREVLRELRVRAPELAEEVGAVLLRPAGARWLLVLAHGAGAGMRHAFMESLARELAVVEVATFRYEFPYVHAHRGRPDPPSVLMATVQAAIAAAREAAPDLPLLAGGKSLGGRMTSQALAETSRAGMGRLTSCVRGVIFFGFPLHPPGRPGTSRADHLGRLEVPMLFLQGTRDTFADLTLLRPLCASLGSRVQLSIVEAADHSFHVPKRTGRTDADIIRDLARTAASWAASLA